MSLRTTTWQTVGPFFKIGLEKLFAANIAGEGVQGDRIRVEGRILDGDGAPIPDAVIEIWQANAHGKYAHPEDLQDKPLESGFRGFGRIPTDDHGYFRFITIKPGSVPVPKGGCRRLISSLEFSCVACCSASSRAPTSPVTPQTLLTRSSI